MSRAMYGAIGFLFFANSAFALITPQSHVPIETEAKEYRAMLRMEGHNFSKADPLDVVINMGEKLYNWIDKINEARDSDFSLSSPESQPGYPITAPIFNNREILLKNFADFKSAAPKWLTDVVLGGGDMTSTMPVAEAEFIKWGLEADKLYRLAARWLLQEPQLWGYAMRKDEDVRGYYHLTNIPNIENRLADWSEMNEELQTSIKPWLVNLCMNSSEEDRCKLAVDKAIKDDRVATFYRTYLPKSKKKWDAFFEIEGAREDITWTAANPNEFHVPFLTPDDREIKDYIQRNLEDEYTRGDWHMILNFTTSGSAWDTPNVRFQPGVTPHVDCLGCSTITMDSNVPLSDYANNWTIRHEFGHVLGLPDCYIEFYDETMEKMVYYQIDVTNIMCSRRGKFSQTQFDEMKKVYFDKK